MLMILTIQLKALFQETTHWRSRSSFIYQFMPKGMAYNYLMSIQIYL